MPEPKSEYAESAKRILANELANPLDGIPLNDYLEREKPEADELTKAEIAARLIDLPEELESPKQLDDETTLSEKWSTRSHHTEDGTLIVNLQTRQNPGYEFSRTTFHVKPDLSIGVWTYRGAGEEPIPLSQPLADTLLRILPKSIHEELPYKQ